MSTYYGSDEDRLVIDDETDKKPALEKDQQRHKHLENHNIQEKTTFQESTSVFSQTTTNPHDNNNEHSGNNNDHNDNNNDHLDNNNGPFVKPSVATADRNVMDTNGPHSADSDQLYMGPAEDNAQPKASPMTMLCEQAALSDCNPQVSNDVTAASLQGTLSPSRVEAANIIMGFAKQSIAPQTGKDYDHLIGPSAVEKCLEGKSGMAVGGRGRYEERAKPGTNSSGFETRREQGIGGVHNDSGVGGLHQRQLETSTYPAQSYMPASHPVHNDMGLSLFGNAPSAQMAALTQMGSAVPGSRGPGAMQTAGANGTTLQHIAPKLSGVGNTGDTATEAYTQIMRSAHVLAALQYTQSLTAQNVLQNFVTFAGAVPPVSQSIGGASGEKRWEDPNMATGGGVSRWNSAPGTETGATRAELGPTGVMFMGPSSTSGGAASNYPSLMTLGDQRKPRANVSLPTAVLPDGKIVWMAPSTFPEPKMASATAPAMSNVVGVGQLGGLRHGDAAAGIVQLGGLKQGDAADSSSGMERNRKQARPQAMSSSSASSESAMDSGGKGAASRGGRPRKLSERDKDDAYRHKRAKNNESAKRSRNARKMKEMEIGKRMRDLEVENDTMRRELEMLRGEVERLRTMTYTT